MNIYQQAIRDFYADNLAKHNIPGDDTLERMLSAVADADGYGAAIRCIENIQIRAQEILRVLRALKLTEEHNHDWIRRIIMKSKHTPGPWAVYKFGPEHGGKRISIGEQFKFIRVADNLEKHYPRQIGRAHV